MATIDVSVLTAADEMAYANLVAASSGSPLSHSLSYRDVLRDLGLGEPLYLLARVGAQLRAVLPAFIKRSALGAVCNSLPLTQSAGGVVLAPDVGVEEREALTVALLQALVRHAKEQAVDVCVVVTTPYGPQDEPHALSPKANFYHRRTTHVSDVTQGLNLHHAAREAVRKASGKQPRHYHASTVEQARAVWSLYAENMRRIAVAARPWPFYESLFRRCGSGVRFVWAEVGGEAVSALVLLSHNEVVDYHSVGNTSVGREQQINTWLCLQELEAARGRGVRWWNWGVSPTPAVHAFKRRFGGHDRHYDIRGYCTGRVAQLRQQTPHALMQAFPDYFVLPYDELLPQPHPTPEQK